MSKVSILMPVKNAMPYLSACIASIKAQSWVDWELIAVDDHSTDGSFQLIQEEDDPRIQIHKSSGQGVIPALQKAYQQSTGAFITRMDADDLMTPFRLEKMIDLLHMSGPMHVCLGLVEYFTDEGELGDGYLKYAEWLNSLSRCENNFDERYKECVIPSPCWMIHRDDFEQVGAFDAHVYPEDYDLAFRMYGAGMKIKTVKEVLLRWRDHGQRTSRNDEKYLDNRFTELKVSHFLAQESFTELNLWGAGSRGKAVAKALNKYEVGFRWFSNNPNKIGHEIYGVQVEAYQSLEAGALIVAIAGDAQNEVRSFIQDRHEISAYYFC